jgi:hypothetical protein
MPQICKPCVLLHGQGIGMTQEEADKLGALTNIRCYFQKKAWADSEFCKWWLLSFKEDVVAAGITDEVLLGLDGLQSQHNQAFLSLAAENNILPFYTPPDCTDVLAPCDHHVFARLKKLIKDYYRQASSDQRDVWASSENNELTASKRRILLATWVSLAWDTLCSGSDSGEFFTKAFTSTGFLMKRDQPAAEINTYNVAQN